MSDLPSKHYPTQKQLKEAQEWAEGQQKLMECIRQRDLIRQEDKKTKEKE